MPELGFPPSKEFRDYFKRQLPSLIRPIRFSSIAQALIGGIIAYKQYLVSRELHTSVTSEEIQSLWRETARNMKGLSTS